MKTILVPVEQHDTMESILELASLAATRFASAIEGFALRTPPLAAFGWDPAGVAMINGSPWEDGEAAAEAKALFEAAMLRLGIAPASGAPAGGGEGPSWSWTDRAAAGDPFLGSYGRAFDLTAVGLPRPKTSGPSLATLESALFDSGGPILIGPHDPVGTLGETIVIAWNGSSETARTIAFAKPFLRRARRVVILADDGALEQAPAGALVRQRLHHNGIAAELRSLPGGAIRSGETILKEAAALGCDLLVKGAYTQSRLRQMIFGGATSHILANAQIPVFMAH